MQTISLYLCRFVKHMRQVLEKIISVTDREIRSLLCVGQESSILKGEWGKNYSFYSKRTVVV